MNEYMTIKETAELWGVTPRWVQALCIIGKFGCAWTIPRNTPKPKDGRGTSGRYENWKKRK